MIKFKHIFVWVAVQKWYELNEILMMSKCDLQTKITCENFK